VTLVLADATQVAAIIAASTGLVAAAVGVANLIVLLPRDRSQLAAFVRRYSVGPHGEERYVAVVATNVGRRPVTVVSVGLTLAGAGRRWRDEEGQASPSLPARLEERASVVMTWLLESSGSCTTAATRRSSTASSSTAAGTPCARRLPDHHRVDRLAPPWVPFGRRRDGSDGSILSRGARRTGATRTRHRPTRRRP